MNRHVSRVARGILLLLLTFQAIAAQDGVSRVELLTNDKVLTLVRAELPHLVIVNKIRASQTIFDTSTDELIRLQRARVPAEIISAMVEASNKASVATLRSGAGDTSRTDPNDPLAPHDAGIYFYQEEDGRKMVQLEPSVSKQTKTGGIFASVMTYGIAKVKFKAALAGGAASLQIVNPRPVFYFYFEVKGSGLSSSSAYATSPNEFVLVKFNTKSNSREVTVAQANAFGSQSGAMDKSSQAFSFEKLAPGVYKVTPQADLAEGEYGFYNGAGVGPSGGAKIFDFGVKRAR